ncbi:hypothetical protein HFX_0186 [Haloferax mediterranei ATCC 33500]|uniref:Uncharacterized protein n=1 Tax=Haloferax mediterranei (strain ATCC 33500 / DSM 1411 / JCM 8866 / NBRC 14739 / NCIMB 2177 / R-4) TaxID=523841 RepID=I3R117_HALMT|nr:hypothetical protein HFX_0186 [Haloferax mediterranei ATCC 33500]
MGPVTAPAEIQIEGQPEETADEDRKAPEEGVVGTVLRGIETGPNAYDEPDEGEQQPRDQFGHRSIFLTIQR